MSVFSKLPQSNKVTAGALQNNLSASSAPTVNDDSTAGYAVGSVWIDTTGDEAYRCLDATATSAVWVKTTLSTDEMDTVLASTIVSATAKTTPVDADNVAITDSEASNVLKVLTIANLKSLLASATQTLTNKRITPRVTSETSSATPTINTDNSDAHSITALATNITSFTTNLSGTPTNFQKLIIRIKDDGTSRTIAWGDSFEAKGVDLPTATTISKVLTVGFVYDTVTSKWGCVASAEEA